ncbi:MAG TPA: 50S ribosomal protein L10 [Gammaproteobacteria bacterium]|jgi:large subunit ribosomal protein L10
MPLNIEAKKALVDEVNTVAASAQAAVAAEYRGLTVAEMTALRVAARKADVYVKVVKNTLAKRAVQGTDFECMRESFKGPLVLAFSRRDPGAAARVIKSFAKDHDKLVTVALALGGELYGAKDIDRVASLPTLDQARAKLLGTLQAPLGQLVRVLAEPAAMLARTLKARSEQAA